MHSAMVMGACSNPQVTMLYFSAIGRCVEYDPPSRCSFSRTIADSGLRFQSLCGSHLQSHLHSRHADDHIPPSYDITVWFKPFTMPHES